MSVQKYSMGTVCIESSGTRDYCDIRVPYKCKSSLKPDCVIVSGSQGQDDLRQDAVMQQVFHMCSTLLQRNAETRKRKLNIRRYKVRTLLAHNKRS